MSIAGTSFGWVMVRRRSKLGEDGGCPMPATRARLRAHGGHPHAAHQRADVPPADERVLGAQEAAQHARAGEGEIKVQRVEPPHASMRAL